MPEPVCCDVHEAIYLSLLCASILYFSFITVALSTFFQSFSWVDLVSCIILFLLLCLSGGRLLLLNAGLSKDVYYEARSYEDILIAEKPDLLSTFPFVRKIEDPDHNLNMMNAKNVSVNLHCNTTISLPQCTQIEKFILERISSMGGKAVCRSASHHLRPRSAPPGGEPGDLFKDHSCGNAKRDPGSRPLGGKSISRASMARRDRPDDAGISAELHGVLQHRREKHQAAPTPSRSSVLNRHTPVFRRVLSLEQFSP